MITVEELLETNRRLRSRVEELLADRAKAEVEASMARSQAAALDRVRVLLAHAPGEHRDYLLREALAAAPEATAPDKAESEAAHLRAQVENLTVQLANSEALAVEWKQTAENYRIEWQLIKDRAGVTDHEREILEALREAAVVALHEEAENPLGWHGRAARAELARREAKRV